ncbi:MAG: HPr family phosphocarrier protein [Candidatus Delongbacteria bacterium]|nr:HPr family phosphocarrier protein [Candidatus Delongbacteria bacterium]MBN2836454.1 HPr family phosphocarrier protein [Candidatus Delongbacteria bacterium]
MVSSKVKITNKLGLHARPAAKFVKISSKYKSDVFIEKDGYEINAKSIMGVMMLAAENGSFLTVKCSGNDEEECLKELVKLIEDKFYEE